jgi:hypothetical protein
MPGEHVDKIYNEAIARLTYSGLSQTELAKLPPEAQKEDGYNKAPERGKDVFNDVESSDLSAEEKQEVYQRLARQGVTTEMQNATNPATLLRGNSQMSNFMSAYMNTYAKDYLESIRDVAFREAAKTQLPESLKGKLPRTAFAEIQGVPSEDVAKLHEAYGNIAQKMITASEVNLSKLSPEARKFLHAALEPTQGNTQAMNMATASTLLLRGASPQISAPGDMLRLDPTTEEVGMLLVGSNVVLQTYANNINIPRDKALDVSKKQNFVAETLRTPENLDQTSNAYNSLYQGGESVDKFVELVKPEELEAPDLELDKQVQQLKDTAQKQNELRLEREKQGILKVQARELAKKEMEKQTQDKAQVQPDLDKLAKLQTRMEKLSQDNPPLGERFKAMFTKGGIEGLKAEVAAKIEKTKLDIVGKVDAVQFGARMDANAERLQKIENQQSQHTNGALAYLTAKQNFEQLHGEFQYEMLKKNGQMTEKAEQLAEKADSFKVEMLKHEGAYNSFNELEEQKQTQQSVVEHGQNIKSVRESLGDKGNKVETPKQSQRVKM